MFDDKVFEEALNWILDSAKLMRPHHTEAAVVACYANKYTGKGDEVQTKDVVVAAAVTIYADSLGGSREHGVPF